VLQRIGAVAYRIRLPEEMSVIHNVFHVSQLKKCLRVPEEQISPDTVDLQDDMRYQEVSIKILDTVTKQTRTTTVQIYRVQWSRHTEAEATWEREDVLRKEFPHLFRNQANLEDEIHFKRGRFVTSQKFTFKNHSHLKIIFKCISKTISHLSSIFFKILSILYPS
jgi:hypothetical protein